MSLEDAISKLTAAVEANTAAQKGGATKAATDTKTTTTKKDTPAKSKHDMTAVNAALEKVKEAKGVDAAKAIIKEAGGVTARKDIPEAKFDAVVEACEKAMAAEVDDDDL